jgi:DNA-binding XRE family transcriptional regulator
LEFQQLYLYISGAVLEGALDTQDEWRYNIGTVMILHKIKLLRIDRKLSQLDMAAKLCVCLRQYRRIESGGSSLTLERIVLIAEVLNVEVDYLTNSNNPLPPPFIEPELGYPTFGMSLHGLLN